MNLAKMSTNGQITVPAEVRRQLKLNSGDKLVFLGNKNGEIIIKNLDFLIHNDTLGNHAESITQP